VQRLFGMAPEIAVGLEGEMDELNVELVSMDRHSDSLRPHFSTAEAVLESVVVAEVAADSFRIKER